MRMLTTEAVMQFIEKKFEDTPVGAVLAFKVIVTMVVPWKGPVTLKVPVLINTINTSASSQTHISVFNHKCEENDRDVYDSIENFSKDPAARAALKNEISGALRIILSQKDITELERKTALDAYNSIVS